MQKPKLIRITTVPMSLEKLLEGQLGFMASNYEVVAISADKERLEKFGKEEGIRIFHLELTRKITPLKDFAAVFKLYQFLRKEKPSIVHTHTPKAGIVGMMAARLANVPNRLHTVAGLPLMEASGLKRKILNFVEKLTYRFATKVYPNSKGLYDFIISEKFTSQKKLSIIGQGSSNGIDTADFDPSLFTEEIRTSFRKKLGIPQNQFVFIFVGRLVKDKGINELVAAFLNLANSNPNISLLLVGPFESNLDPLLPETLSQIENHQGIYSVGYQNDVRSYFSISDALVFPSYREGFPNVVMQAGAMGLPAIVTNINGCNEIIENEINGLIISPKNVKELETAMNLISTDTYLYKNLKAVARQKIVSRFSRLEIWQALLKEYQTL
ncbi:glycosyl transferase family 1 [Aequorivita soesokkakensis]|uniref:Glycosyl transferase family 1 n=1 Tax=Aequorivita soesokkakensis TaxID=1385699 RepID=A0A1A9L9I0_9FLAO|nr:glycosyltransferase family 4 protein [Aequorivita soesokkakensis]OAD89989.1 glycosyl transferase family 1 [Aequorivita soesokkakensis]